MKRRGRQKIYETYWVNVYRVLKKDVIFYLCPSRAVRGLGILPFYLPTIIVYHILHEAGAAITPEIISDTYTGSLPPISFTARKGSST